MHKTHPKKCEHKLKYCEQCDVVYCEVCGEEWKKDYITWTTTSAYPYGVSGTGTYFNNNNCTHQ